jgi:RecJ-like exonuclease
MRYHFIREAVASEKIQVKYCNTKFMLADILTKGMSRQRHEELAQQIGLEKLGNVGVLND